MPLSPTDQKNVDDFFSAIRPQRDAYRYATFSYLGIKQPGGLVLLLKSRVSLNIEPSLIPLTHFHSINVRAGCYRLNELNLDLDTLIEGITAETINTPHGPLWFPSGPGGRYAAQFVPFHPDGMQTQRRINVLTIMGNQSPTPQQPDLDWEVKAATPPYDSLNELVLEYGIGPSLMGNTTHIEIVAFNVAAIDAAKSGVSGEDAAVHVLLAQGLTPDKVSVGYRVYKPGAPTVRGVLSSSSFNWSEEEFHRHGVASIHVPTAAVLNCTASYDGIAQGHWWLFDPSRSQNSGVRFMKPSTQDLRQLRTLLGRHYERAKKHAI
jgi:hypothetical protein